MSLLLDDTALAAIATVATGIAGTVTAVVRHLYLAREAERAARLADQATFTTEMLAAAKALREEDARENAELRAKLEAATAPPPSTRMTARRKSR